MAKRYEYEYIVIHPSTSWALNPSECARKNSHGVKLQTIRDMKEVYNSIPIHVFNALMKLEFSFDPVECVQAAQLAMESNEPFIADECVIDFQDWRTLGGFPPAGAEDTIESIDKKLKSWRKEYWKSVNWTS
jgi:hypothetical protein